MSRKCLEVRGVWCGGQCGCVALSTVTTLIFLFFTSQRSKTGIFPDEKELPDKTKVRFNFSQGLYSRPAVRNNVVRVRTLAVLVYMFYALRINANVRGCHPVAFFFGIILKYFLSGSLHFGIKFYCSDEDESSTVYLSRAFLLLLLIPFVLP